MCGRTLPWTGSAWKLCPQTENVVSVRVPWSSLVNYFVLVGNVKTNQQQHRIELKFASPKWFFQKKQNKNMLKSLLAQLQHVSHKMQQAESEQEQHIRQEPGEFSAGIVFVVVGGSSRVVLRLPELHGLHSEAEHGLVGHRREAQRHRDAPVQGLELREAQRHRDPASVQGHLQR